MALAYLLCVAVAVTALALVLRRHPEPAPPTTPAPAPAAATLADVAADLRVIVTAAATLAARLDTAA